MLRWSVGVFALLVLWWAWHRYGTDRVTNAGAVRAVTVVGAVLVIVVGIVSLIEVVVNGHAGAASVWKG